MPFELQIKLQQIISNSNDVISYFYGTDSDTVATRLILALVNQS